MEPVVSFSNILLLDAKEEILETYVLLLKLNVADLPLTKTFVGPWEFEEIKGKSLCIWGEEGWAFGQFYLHFQAEIFSHLSWKKQQQTSIKQQLGENKDNDNKNTTY